MSARRGLVRIGRMRELAGDEVGDRALGSGAPVAPREQVVPLADLAKSIAAVITSSPTPALASVTGKPGNSTAAITLPPAHSGGPWLVPTRLAEAAAMR